MGEYHINGGKKIKGEIRISGAKNAILPILAATVLNNGVSVIYDCPDITDTHIAIEILKSIGCKVDYSERTITIDSRNVNNVCVPHKLVKEMRSSIVFMGSILGRFNEVSISYPGGCELGSRPIGLHIKGLKDMGASISEENEIINCKTSKLNGVKLHLEFPSVGATENIMLAAVLADGETVISNAAKEPEIVDLQNFLNKMGAYVNGAGTDTITIKGVKTLSDVEYTVMPDRIVAGTFLVAAAISKGEILLHNVNANDIYPITSRLTEVGCQIIDKEDKILLKAPNKLKRIKFLNTSPHPGFPTDMQSQFTAMLSIANGSSEINETIFDSRNNHISELKKMGADIILSQDGRTSFISGVNELKGGIVKAKDLRGGAALILAGIASSGKTVVLNSCYVERGYEKIEESLNSLGADIKFTKQ